MTRAEHAIAVGRLILALFMLGAIWVDPSQPARLREATYAALILYALAASVGHAVSKSTRFSKFLAISLQLLEIALFAFLMHVTEGPTSPFFLLFTFSILSAALRWGWRGALWTSVTVLALYLASISLHVWLGPPLPIEVDRLLIRGAHILVVGAMLVFFGYQRDRLQAETLQISGSGKRLDDTMEPEETFAECGRYAGSVFGAETTRLILEDRLTSRPRIFDGHGAEIFTTGTLDLDLTKQMLEKSQHCLAGELGSLTLRTISAQGHAKSVNASTGFGALCSLFDAHHLLIVPIRTQGYLGQLAVLNRSELTLGDMMVATLVGRNIESALNRTSAIEASRRALAGDERLRMARDLHDGVLQSLAAAVMQLEALRRVRPADAASRIGELQAWLTKEQRLLRGMVERMRAPDALPPMTEGTAAEVQFASLAVDIQRQWGISLHLDCRPTGLGIGQSLGFEIRQIIREAAANAARHGRADRLDASIVWSEDRIDLRIRDNGRGLSQQGSFNQELCDHLGIGPRSLRERVHALNGQFYLRSGPDGLSLELSLPAVVEERK
ncbi:sensor histidine kinase [Limimaricola soesokkakensis]